MRLSAFKGLLSAPMPYIPVINITLMEAGLMGIKMIPKRCKHCDDKMIKADGRLYENFCSQRCKSEYDRHFNRAWKSRDSWRFGNHRQSVNN